MRLQSNFANMFVVLTAHHCANERQECTCNGNVIYGVDTTWSEPKEANGKIMCTNDVFGDPAPGLNKRCLCTPRSK